MIKYFAKSEDGASAVEFALVAPIFFLMLIATMEIALKTMMQAQLDQVMFRTTMQLSIEEDMSVSKADYKANVVCPGNSLVLLDCGQVQFGVAAISTNTALFSSSLTNGSVASEWSTGCGGSNVIVEFLYPMPNILLDFGIVDQVTHNGEPHMRSRGMARREPVLSGSGTLNGGATC